MPYSEITTRKHLQVVTELREAFWPRHLRTQRFTTTRLPEVRLRNHKG